MRIVTIKNPEPLETPFTTVGSDYSSGITLTVEDSSGFKDNDLILVGGQGNEKAETTDLTATPPSETTMSITALGHGHQSDESVQRILWNKYDVQYKTDIAGAWVDLALAQDFDWSGEETSYIDSAGASNYYYRSRYYNSATNTYSDYSGTVSATGSVRSTVGAMIDNVRENAKDKTNQKVSDERIINYLNTAQDVVKSMKKKWPWLQAEAVIDPATLALPTDYERAYRLKYNFVNGTDSQTYYLKYLPLVDFQNKYTDNNASTSDYLEEYTIDDVNGVVKLGPVPETTTAILTLVYEKDITDLEDYEDETIIPIPALLEAYATARVWKLKSNEEEYNSWMESFADLLQVLDQAREKSYHPRTLKRYMGREFGGHMNIVSEDYMP